MTSSPDTQSRLKNRKRTTCSLGSLTHALFEPYLRRAGFAQSAIITHWADIVGPEFARASIPISLRFPQGARRGGRLEVRIAGAMAPRFQHVQDVILERINTYYGWQAVGTLVLRHGFVPQSRFTPPAAPPLEKRALPDEITTLPNSALKRALAAAWVAKSS
jgi:hypothetical protein